MKKKVNGSLRFPFHYAWLILVIVFFVTLTGGGIRSASSVLIQPFEMEFGWSRVVISSVIGLNLLLSGLGSPLAGWLIDRFGPRRISIWTLCIIGSAIIGSLFMSSLWQFYLYWGLMIGLSSSGIGSVIAGPVVNSWFITKRGLALGIINSSVAASQIIFLPTLIMVINSVGWRFGLKILLPVIAVVLFFVVFWLRNDPDDIGLEPYGGTREILGGGATAKATGPGVSMSIAIRSSTFWLLVGSFFICGGTSLGLIGTHFIPHTLDHGIPPGTTATTIGLMGAMNFLGVIFSGWLTDRIDPRKILLFVFSLRGLSLLVLPFINDSTGLYLFGIIFGLDTAATIPPVIALTSDIFGKRSLGMLYGFIFLAHQVGASLAALGGGALRDSLGNYQMAFILSGGIALIAAALALGIPSRKALQSKQHRNFVED